MTINQSKIGTTEYATICHGETYTWNGHTYNTSDTYTLILSNEQGCDSTATLVLTVLPESVTQTENVVIGSDQLPYIWRGQSLNAIGQYTDIEQYVAAACDSVIHVLNLNILATGATDEQTVTICDTELPYQWYNQDYSTTGTYTHIEKYAGTDIDSIQHILNLAVNATIRTEETAIACDSYTWNGQTYTESGEYTYTTTAANGCDSIVTLHLTINQTQYAEEIVTACDSYTWNGETYTASGEYVYTTVAANGCDSIVTLHLTINNSSPYTIVYDTICYGQTYTWNDSVYYIAGQYSQTLTNIHGCDSIVTLNLVILPDVQYFSTDTLLCYGVVCEWRGKQYIDAGIYSDTIKNVLGCDSLIYTLDVAYLPDVVYIPADTLLCHGVTCEWREMQLTVAGHYSDTVPNSLGCDSLIYTLDVAYLPDVVYIPADSATICHGEKYIWRDKEYTNAGDYNDTVRNILHCDSLIYTFNLTVNYATTFDTTVVACDEFEWLGRTLNKLGVYVDTLTNMVGCDSIVTLNLVVYNSDTAYFAETVCDTYTWHDSVYTTSGTYYYLTETSHGCDSLEVLHLTVNYTYYTEQVDTMAGYNPYYWHGDTLLVGGEYLKTLTAITGCDSVVTLYLHDNPVGINDIFVPEQCAGDGMVDLEIFTTGYIDSLRLACEPEALALGMRDTTFTVPADGHLSYAHDARAGVHLATLTGYFHREEVLRQDLTFTVLYPNTIFEQQWNDMIAILTPSYNGGYDFIAFQWYKDGKPLIGETHSYLHQSLSLGVEYSVLLTAPDGVQLMSCPILPIDLAEISVYPTMVMRGESVTCHITEDATLQLYSSTGKMIESIEAAAGDIPVMMPNTAGVYMLKVLTINNREREVKIIVQ